MKFALQYNDHTIDAYAPDTQKAEYDRISAVKRINMRPVNADTKLKIGQMEISFCEVAHPVTTYAVKVRAGGKTFVSSGDTYYIPQLEAFCRMPISCFAKRAFWITRRTKKTSTCP